MEAPFRILLPALIIAFAAHRGYYVRRHGKEENTLKKRESANWFIGFAWTGMTLLEVASRIGFEESLMLEYFGDQYRAYMKRTGRLLPKFI